MGFFDEIENLFLNEEIDKSFKVECYGNKAILVSGYKKIININDNEVSLKLKSGNMINITGAKLYIKKLEESEIVVAGTILNLSFS